MSAPSIENAPKKPHRKMLRLLGLAVFVKLMIAITPLETPHNAHLYLKTIAC